MEDQCILPKKMGHVKRVRSIIVLFVMHISVSNVWMALMTRLDLEIACQ